jgi:hypothetical protein
VIGGRSINAAPFVLSARKYGGLVERGKPLSGGVILTTWFLSDDPETLKVQASSAFDSWL